MRKIKFRGKSIVSGEWVEGDLIQDTNADNQEEAWIITDDYSGDVITFGTCQSPQVDINTIGQYTGLKDKHGVKIYEGDIVNMHYFYENFDSSLGVYEDEKEIIGIIKINEYGVYLETKCNEIYYLCIYVQEPTEELEIIGNIWDAGGLLKESD